jgi:hypothetical protein
MSLSSEEVEEEVLVECENCEVKVEEYHAHSLCEECYHEVYVTCCHCEGEVYEEESYYSSNSSDYYCGDCYFEIYTSCYECEEEVERDTTYWHNDEPYCEYHLPDTSDCLVENIENAIPPSMSRDAETFDRLNVKRLVGLEAECMYPYTDSIHTPSNWATTYDGSISTGGDYEGIELVSTPSSGDLLYSQVFDLVDWAKGYDAVVNSSCGLHVHFDSTNLNARQVAHIGIVYSKYQHLLKDMMPPSRQSSRWCKDFSMNVDTLRNIDTEEELIEEYYESMNCRPSTEKYNDARYCGLNLHSRYFHGSLEFRLHSGTLSKTKIVNWIRILNAIIEKGIEIEKDSSLVDEFLKYGEYDSFVNTIGQELITYHSKRVMKFAS